jgi:glycosyltransferase involved in cell wall biosynthesis
LLSRVMKDEPLVSIALCTYNGEKYIRQQLDSILDQTYRNLEVIIVDDCSTDNTFNIVSDYAGRDSRIRCFKNEINLGFNKNFEWAITLTTGSYIAISDQDDIWLPRKIESLLNAVQDKWLVFSDSVFINDHNQVLESKMFHTDNTATNKYMRSYKSILLGNFVTGHTTLFKKEFINYFLPFPENGFYDWWMGFVALYHQKIVFLGDVLTQYRVDDASVMHNRIISGKQKQQAVIATDYMLSCFALYNNLKNEDREFIINLKDAYESKLSKNISFPLIKIILKNYSDIFAHQKSRTGFPLLNFVLKYVRKVKQYSQGLSSPK